FLQQRARRRGAEQQGFGPSPQIQNAISEDMAALEIAGKLDLVNGNELGTEIKRHRLDRRNPESRLRRNDLLFTGDERHDLVAETLDKACIDFAGKQPQRQADQPRGLSYHALDRQMSLAGV